MLRIELIAGSKPPTRERAARYSQTLPHETVRRAFDIHDDIPLRPCGPGPRFNIAPGIDVDVVRLRPDGRRELVPMR